jgi:hypothetical protein
VPEAEERQAEARDACSRAKEEAGLVGEWVRWRVGSHLFGQSPPTGISAWHLLRRTSFKWSISSTERKLFRTPNTDAPPSPNVKDLVIGDDLVDYAFKVLTNLAGTHFVKVTSRNMFEPMSTIAEYFVERSVPQVGRCAKNLGLPGGRDDLRKQFLRKRSH